MMSFLPLDRAAAAPDCTALLDALAGGDRQALGRLYAGEGAAVYHYALGLCGDAQAAADATQEAFVALAVRPQAFDAHRGSLGAYLAGIARHALLAHWRHAARHSPLDEQADAAQEQGLAASPEALLVRAQSLQAVQAAIQRLPFAQREAVVLVDLQERPYAEAAAIAGCELNTLRTRLHRARARLADMLNSDIGDRA